MVTDKEEPVHPLKAHRPADAVIELIDRSSFARGGCVGAYAQVEFILAHFVMSAETLEAYRDESLGFPSHFGARLKRVRRIAELPGPLESERSTLLEIARRIEAWEEYRHYLTHGWMDVHHRVATGDVTFLFRRWVVEKGAQTKEHRLELSIETMEAARLDLIEVAEFTLKSFHTIYGKYGFDGWRMA